MSEPAITTNFIAPTDFSVPPGPRGRLLPTLRVIRSPRKMFSQCVEKYGDPFLVRALNGPIVITGRADLVDTIFRADPDHYEVFAKKTIEPILGSGSMLMMDGQVHRRERKLMAPMFHGDRMKAYGDTMQTVARRAVSEISPGSVFHGIDLGTQISLQVIVRTVLGADLPETQVKVEHATRHVLRNLSPILFFSSKTQFPLFGFSFMDRFRQAKSQMESLLQAELDARAESLDEREDILSIMARTTYEDGEPIERQHLFSEIGTMLFAGHETTAVALAWAMYHLHRHPKWLAEVKQELAAAPDTTPTTLTNLPVLKAVIQETLRMHPIVTEVIRKLRTPLQLGEFMLPKGHSVAAASIVAHYDPNVFEDPDSFNPERFVDRKYSPSQYFPFGGGQRRCIGAAFSLYEIAIVLGTLLGEHEFELHEPKPVRQKRRNLTMGPSTGIQLRLVK